jgi:glycosyltransferase involved in cell wall biosynthesis
MSNKVWYIFTDSSGRGGVGLHALGLARALSRRGFEVIMIVYKTPNLYYSLDECCENIKVHHCAELFEKGNFIATTLHWYKYLSSICVQPGTAIYYRGVAGSGSTAVLLALRLRLKSVYTVEHALASLPQEAWGANDNKNVIHLKTKAKLESLAVRNFIAVSTAAKESMIKITGHESSRILVCNNGVDVHKYRPCEGWRYEKRKLLELSNEDIIVGFVGRFSVEKRPEELLKGFKLLLDSGVQRVKLLFFGEGPLLWKCKNFAKLNQIDSSVKFIGWQNNMSEWLPVLDAFVIPSISESLSLALLEAMATGLVCLCHDNRGNGQVIRHGYNGFLADLSNPHLIRNALSGLIDIVPTEGRSIGIRARQTVELNFNQDIQTRKLLAFIGAG